MNEVNRVLSAIDQGDPSAAAQLLPLVYDELRALAAAKLAHEKPGQTLDATALVHEAYLRLVNDQRFQNCRHFFAAAAAAQVAHLHLFGGLSVEETGEALGLSRAVAYRNWKYARAWLRVALE